MNKVFTLVICLAFTQLCFSQQANENPYYHPVAERSTGQSGTGANIDVVYHRAWWRVNPDSAKGIRGIVTTYFKTTQANVSVITFDLRKSAFDNADLEVTYHGSFCLASISNSNVLSITLPTTLTAINTLDSVTISYYGAPPNPQGAAQGFQRGTYTATSPATVTQNFINTLSESYEDRDWWPCKADMQDKIDSMDIIVNTPWTGADTFWVATNGRLVDSTISGGRRTFTFKNTYPMASYLVCLSVARYNRYYRGTVNQGGIQVPVVYYLFRGKTNSQYNNILASMDHMTTLLTELSNKFGYYPFRRDKHGFYEGLAGAAGMEHQTFSAMATSALNSRQTLAHELMHQWFGNKATFATWADLWLAEGFARYGEVMIGELVPASGVNAQSELSAARSAARGVTNAAARISSFTNSTEVWGGSNVTSVYDRGCMVVSMLRALAGDEKFFEACRNYLDSTNGSGFKSATTDSLKNNFDRVLNTNAANNLTPFFNDYVLGSGHPTYTINWQAQAGGGIYVSVGSQTRNGGTSGQYYNTPVVLRVQGSAGKDTTIVFYDLTNGNHTSGNLAKAGNGIGTAQPGNRLFYPLSFVPTTVSFDPFSRTIAGGSTAQVSTLDLKIVSFDVQKNPNSNIAYLSLDGNSINSTIILERSADGINFTDFGTMDEMAGASSEKSYSLTDDQPLDRNNFYRAKFRDINGQLVYSRIVKIAGNKAGTFSIAGNVVMDDIRVLSPEEFVGKTLQFTLYNGEGKRIAGYHQKINSALTILKLPVIAAGNYFIEIREAERKLATLKLIK